MLSFFDERPINI